MISKNLSKKTLVKENILILGTGYIGRYIYNTLKDIHNTKIVSTLGFDYHDNKDLSKFILNNDISIIINCSGFTGRPNVDEAELKKDECWRLNVVSPLSINTLCNKLGVKYIHISSGCIYNGYDKVFTEEDTPNFGLFDTSSFYSKSKHAFELMSTHLDNKIIRIRMPICNDLTNPRNYLKKIMEYKNLINYTNSKTYIPDLCDFISCLIVKSGLSWTGQDIYNVVNSKTYNTREVIEHLNVMNEGNWEKLDPNWVDIQDLKIIAPRSNCTLDNSKSDEIFKLHTEYEIMNMVCNYNNGISGV